MKDKKRLLAGILSATMVIPSVFGYSVPTEAAEEVVLEAENYASQTGVKVMESSDASGGKYVGDFSKLDTLSYNIDIEKAGNYKVVLRVATVNSGGKTLINSNASFSDEVIVPNTGGWQAYQDVELTLWLNSGVQKVTVTNTNSTWNIDKLTFTYLNSDKEPKNLEKHETVYLENRWQNDRIIEREGNLQYAEPGDADYNSNSATWNLIPDEGEYYIIENASTGRYLTMTEGSNEVSLAEGENISDAGKWAVGNMEGYLEFFNKQYNNCITVEYKEDYPDKILATDDTLAKWYSAQWGTVILAQNHYYTISGDRIEGTAGTAVASEDGQSITADQAWPGGTKKSWTLTEDLSGTPTFEAENMPIMEAVYNLSMEETLKSIHDGVYGDVFWTGTSFAKVWTRDTAMSVQYSLAWIFPEITKNSILEKVIGAEGNPQIWEEDTGTGGSYPNSIDRIIMQIAGWELYKTTGDEKWLEQIYEISKSTLEQDYHVIYDEASGLFKGETGGLDHRSKTYPDWMDEREEDSIINIAESKAANANIIFAESLKLMAESAEILGKDRQEIAGWEKKYEELKTAINEHFWLEDRGMYASWEYPQYMGSPVADKVDVIANGYAIMFDIANEEQKQRILENYPMVIYGANTVWPQKNGRQAAAIYHNRGVWPGWEPALMIGAKENGNNQIAEEVLKSCVQGAGLNLTNKEILQFETGAGVGSNRQLWSIAGTLASYYRVLFGMSYDLNGISFHPYVPEWMEGPYSLNNYVYRDAVLNLTVNGKGDTLTSITVNGEEKPLDYVLPTDAQGTFDIEMTVTDSGKRSEIHLEEDSWAVCPDLPILTENEEGTLTWTEDERYTYKLWNGNEFIPVSAGSYAPDRSVYGAYSLVAVDENGITSEMSKPVIISPEGWKTVYEAEDGEYNEENFEAIAKGYTGTGYVVDFLKKKTDLRITVEAPQTGKYAISMIYNNYGDATTGQDAGIRSVYIDGKDVGTFVFPIVKFDFQQSSYIFVELEKGTHTIDIRYNVEDWYDTNMCTSRGNLKNSVSYDSLSLQFIGTKDTDKPEDLAEAIRQAKEAAAQAEAARTAAEKALEDARSEAAKAAAKAEEAKTEAANAIAKAEEAKKKAEAAESAKVKAEEAARQAAENAGATEEDRQAAKAAKEAAEAARDAAQAVQKEAETAKEAAETAKAAAQTAQSEAVKAQKKAVDAQGKAEAAKGAAEEAKEAAAQSEANALEAKKKAEAAKEAAEAAKTAAQADAEEAKKANEEAGKAKDTAEAAAKEAEIAQQLAEAQAKVADKAADESKAYAEKAEAAKKAAEEAAKRAEEERKKAEEELKKVKEESEKKLAEMRKLLEEARKLRLQSCLDFKAGSWYEDYVTDVYLRGYMTGMDTDYFGINETLVRAQFAVILYRMAGEPEVEFKDNFADVKDGQFYSDAVVWASEEGIITGYEDSGLFGPNDRITREQMATIMYRYRYAGVEEKKEKDEDTEEVLKAFPDAEKVSEFAKEALAWCVEEGIITGKTVGDEQVLEPQGNTLRAECAAIISRFAAWKDVK